MLRSSQEACTHPKRWPPPRPRACWGRWGGGNWAKYLQVTTKCDRSHRPPFFLPCLKKKVYLEDIFLKIFWPRSNRGRVHRLPERTQKGWRAFTQNIFQLRFWFFNCSSGLFEKSFFSPTLIHFHSHTFIQSVAPYWLHKLLCFTSEIFCHKRALLSQRYHLLHRGDRSYSSAPYLQSKNFNNRYLKEKICPYKQGTLDLYPDRIWATMYVFTNTAFQGWDPALKFQSRKIISIPFFFRI